MLCGYQTIVEVSVVDDNNNKMAHMVGRQMIDVANSSPNSTIPTQDSSNQTEVQIIKINVENV